MLSEKEILERWNKKTENYIKIYVGRIKRTLMEAREKFFINIHEKFLETIPTELKIFLQIVHDQNKRPW